MIYKHLRSNPIRIRHIRGIIFFFLLCQHSATAQTTDTTLVMMYAKSFFFNVLETQDGRVLAGSSDGIFELRDAELQPVDGRSGYVKIEKDGKPGIDPNGLRYANQSTFLHLLPFPEVDRNEFHATREPFLYIVSGGRLYVFEIKPFGHVLTEHSIRTISPHLTGTYSGIYYRGNRLPTPAYPGFTDGYIREFGDKVFISFDKLRVFQIRPGDSALRPLKDIPKLLDGTDVFDVRYSVTTREYFLFTNRQVIRLDSGLNQATVIHTGDSTGGALVMTLMTPHFIVFSENEKLVYYDLYGGKTRIIGSLPEPVMDGAPNGLYWYVLCPSGLYAYNRKDSLHKLTDLNRAHTLLANRDGEFVIGTDIGLMHYDINARKLSTLIKGVEFNRRALALIADRIHAGSINGLYLLDNTRLQDVIRLNDKPKEPATVWPRFAIGSLAVLLLATSLMAVLYLRSRRKIAQLSEVAEYTTLPDAKPKLTREDIEAFIRSDLALASLKSIKERFQSNNVQVYNLLAPEKPGGFIHRLRMEIVMEMKAKGATSSEIAQKTGLSESYVRKIWKKT